MSATSHVPPQNVDVEASVIGAMLVAPPAVELVVAEARLAPGDFYLDKHRVLFGCICHLHGQGRAVDELTVVDELDRHGKLEEAGGKHYVSELAAKVPAAGNAAHYAEIVRQNAVLRQLLGAGQEIQGWVHSRNGDHPDELHRRATTLLAGLAPIVVDGASWHGSAADLLSRPDPGPTPFVIEGLLVENAIGVEVGAYKKGKTWLLLAMAAAIASGRPMFGDLEVKQGPVLVVLEESGEAALHRRLGMIARGFGLAPSDLVDLHFAANARVRLDDPAWQGRLLVAAQKIGATQIFLDPLVRLKGSADENSQAEMAPVLDFIRDLRDAAGAGVCFAHHTGHDARGRMRGTSDLEGYWESKITLSAEEGSDVAELHVEHREAERSEPITYRRVFDGRTDSLLLQRATPPATRTDLVEELLSAIRFTPGRSTTELAKAVGKRRQDTASRLEKLETDGTAYRGPSERADRAGRRRTQEGWFPASQSGSDPVPNSGTGQDALPIDPLGRPDVPALKGRTGDGVPDGAGISAAAPGGDS